MVSFWLLLSVMAEALKGVYRPRNPQSTSFYRLVEDHGERLKNVYPDRYEHQFGYYRPITDEVFFRYLDCGILRCGFARIRCERCHHEYLLPDVAQGGTDYRRAGPDDPLMEASITKAGWSLMMLKGENDWRDISSGPLYLWND